MNDNMKSLITFLKKNWLNIGIILGAIIMVIAAINIGLSLLDYQKASTVYDDLEQDYVIVADQEKKEDKNQPASQEQTSQEAPEVAEIPWNEMVKVNMEGLQELNPDIKGWIYFENETISYPILQGKDNEEYIRTTYNGKEATAGSIFMDVENKADFTDNHTLIYGHNMKDLTMFGKLKYYKTDEDYFPDHKYFQIITSNKKLRYQVFAYKEVEEDSLIYAVYSNSNTDFYKFAKNVISSANQCPEGVIVGYDDRVVTLSTCTDRDDKRFVVCGILVEELEY